MRNITIGVWIIATSLLGGTANATLLTSKISMDNGFSAYISTSDTEQGTRFGKGGNWETTYTHTTTLTSGVDYFLHIYGVDWGWIAGFLGEFSLSGTDHTFSNSSTSLLTDTVHWQGNNTGWANPYHSLGVVHGNNGVWPWYNRPGISGAAKWIWSGHAINNDHSYFSTAITAKVTPPPAPLAPSIPEPGVLFLFGIGFVSFAGIRSKRNSWGHNT